MDGVLLVDKPCGPTSHDVVARLRSVTREKSIGHTGTLDPRATGLLPLVLGKATRLASLLTGADKTYEAVVRLGEHEHVGRNRVEVRAEGGAAALGDRQHDVPGGESECVDR